MKRRGPAASAADAGPSVLEAGSETRCWGSRSLARPLRAATAPFPTSGPGPPHASPDRVPEALIARPPRSPPSPGLSRRGVFSVSHLGSPHLGTSQVSTVPQVSMKERAQPGRLPGTGPTVTEAGVARPCHARARWLWGTKENARAWQGRCGEELTPARGRPPPRPPHISADPRSVPCTELTALGKDSRSVDTGRLQSPGTAAREDTSGPGTLTSADGNTRLSRVDGGREPAGFHRGQGQVGTQVSPCPRTQRWEAGLL